MGQGVQVGSRRISLPLRAWNFLARIFLYAARQHMVHSVSSTLILFEFHGKQDANLATRPAVRICREKTVGIL